MKVIIAMILLLSWGYVFRNPHITDSYENGYSAIVVILFLLMVLL